MRKINLLFLTLMLIFASNMYAQDIVYLDFDRTNWTATAPMEYVITDGGVYCEPILLLDDNHRTYLAFAKPGKEYAGVTGPDEITDLGFVIDMKTAQVFNYIRLAFRTSNAYARLRPQLVSLYGSNDATEPTFTTGTWTQIKSGGENTFMPPLADQDGQASIVNTNNIDVDNSTAYRYVKVVFEDYISGSGSTLNMGDFYVGRTTTDKVIVNPGDVAFGDVEAGVTITKELAIKGYNLNNTISYIVTGDGADAFTVARKPGTSLTSLLDSVVVTFKPTERKLYEAELKINMTAVLEPQTVELKGNADFDLPVRISTGTDHWYFIQFERQSAAGTVLTKTADDRVKQSVMVATNNDQMWKITGTWDNYKIINKSGEQLYYVPAGEDDGGNVFASSYSVGAAGDPFGFVRYGSTEIWQLKNTSTTLGITDNKFYLNDSTGITTVTSAVVNNAGNQLRFISADEKAFVYAADTIKIGSVARLETGKLTVSVAGLNLTDDITVAMGNDIHKVYTLNTASLPKEGGLIEIIFAPTAYKTVSYATVTLTSGTLSESFVVSATSDIGMSKYYIGAWNYTPEDGEIVETIPTALVAGDEMWVAKGEYTVAQINIPANVSVYGGFSGTETSVGQRVVEDKPWVFANPTILKNSAALTVKITGASTVVDGITFEGTVNGRAIENTTASATDGIIRNCIMRNFNSNADGGAMNIRYKTEIYDCQIANNKGNKGGGGYLDGVLIHDCEITGNSVPTTASNSIGNVSGGGGGLLLVASEAYNLYVAENTSSFGGGIFPRTTSIVYNSIIVNNTAKSGGGISFDERDSGTLIYNVTVAENNATEQGGVGGVNFAANTDARKAKLYNSILWNNTDVDGEVYNIGISGSVAATPEIKSIIIDDLEYYVEEYPTLIIIDGIAENDETKLFVDKDSWTTSSNSPGINKGFTLLTEEEKDPDSGDIIVPATYLEFATGKDYAGNARIVDGTIDIGPYEYSEFSAIARPVTEPEGNVIDVKYYNMQGVEVSTPSASAVYIKKELLDTGKTRATKVLFTGKYINQ